MVAYRKIKHTITAWSGNSTSWYRPKRTESRISKRCPYARAHGSITRDNQSVDAAQVSTDG